jgi:hypothetical protein
MFLLFLKSYTFPKHAVAAHTVIVAHVICKIKMYDTVFFIHFDRIKRGGFQKTAALERYTFLASTSVTGSAGWRKKGELPGT